MNIEKQGEKVSEKQRKRDPCFSDYKLSPFLV
jgi:hypothetical protein